MSETAEPESSPSASPGAFWRQVHDNKVIQWGLAYLGTALALAHGAELLGHAFHRPDAVWRTIVIALVVGFPVALTVAWYHGHRGLKSFSAPETAIISVLLLIGAVFFYAATRPANEHSAPVPVTTLPATDASSIDARTTPAQPPAASVLPNSVAVLPFANTSSDPDQEYLADGLSEELMSSLASIDELQVTGRTSSFYFKGKNEDLRTIGETLGVQNILEGSVRKSGEQLRITTQLVNARTGYQLWSEIYERTPDDIFAIQDDIAKSVAEALQITLGVGELGRIPGMTRNVAAYDELLKGRALASQFHAEAMRSAIEHLNRAVGIDPSFSLAWSTLASTYVNGSRLASTEGDEWRRRGAEAADRAKELTPDAPFVLISEAYARVNEGAWREAAVLLDQLPALATSAGSYAIMSAVRSQFLTFVGRTGDAITLAERARAAEPLSSGIALLLGEAYAASGALDAALNEFDRGLQFGEFIGPLRTNALMTALASGDRDEISRRIEASTDGRDISIAMARFLDNPAGAASEIRSLAASVGESPFGLSFLATWAAYYGEHETALALLRRIPASRNSDILTLSIWRPIMGDVRKLPGFKDLVQETGLVEYWREYGWADFCRPIGDNDFTCE